MENVGENHSILTHMKNIPVYDVTVEFTSPYCYFCLVIY